MNRKTIYATLALLGSGAPLSGGCDGPKEVPPTKAKADAKADTKADAKAEMSCAPGACGGEGKCGGKAPKEEEEAKP